MARDDYYTYGPRGSGTEGFNDREWQQGSQRGFPGQHAWYTQGGGGYGQAGYGQAGYGPGGYGWSGQSGFGPGGYGRGGYGSQGFEGGYGLGYQGGTGQMWGGGRPGWQGREGQGMYGQGGYGLGGYGQGGIGAAGGQQGWVGEGRDYPRGEYELQGSRDRESWSGPYGERSGFSGFEGSQQGIGREGYGSQAYWRQGYGRGQFAGRGPKGYRRSDERIREDVSEELTRHPEIDATEIEVQVKDGEVTLSGVVEDRRAKRLAEDIAEHCPGVNEVHNRLHARHGIGQKIADLLTGEGSERQTGADREASESRSRSGRTTAG